MFTTPANGKRRGVAATSHWELNHETKLPKSNEQQQEQDFPRVSSIPFGHRSQEMLRSPQLDKTATTMTTHGIGQILQAGSRDYSRKETVIWAKNDRYAVKHLGPLPAMVINSLNKCTDEEYNRCTGSVDTLSGYAILCIGNCCYLWSYDNNKMELTNPRKFSLPTEYKCTYGTCSATLTYNRATNFNKKSTPIGLLACTTEGDLCYWDDINLSAVDEFHREKLPIRGQKDSFYFINCEPAGYGLVTRFESTIYFISVPSIRSSYTTLQVKEWHTRSHESGGLLSKIIQYPLRSVSNRSIVPVQIVSGPLEHETASRLLLRLTKDALQVWRVIRGSLPKFEFEVKSLQETLKSEVLKDFAISEGHLDVEPLGVSVIKDEQAILLISCRSDTHVELSSLYFFHVDLGHQDWRVLGRKCLEEGKSLEVSKFRLLCESSDSIIVYGPDSVIWTSIKPNFQVYTIPFGRNREIFLGGQICSLEPERTRHQSFILVSIPSGLIHVDVATPYHTDGFTHFKGGVPSGPGVKSSPKNLVKEKLEQLIFFNDEKNPIELVFTNLDLKDLEDAIDQLLKEILDSNSVYIDSALDLMDTFAARLRYLDDLANLLGESNMIHSISGLCRFSIGEDMEKLLIASKLWGFTSDALSRNPPDTVFLNVLRVKLEEHYRSQNYPLRDDIVRHFFRHHVADIFEIFSGFLSCTSSSATVSQTTQSLEKSQEQLFLSGICTLLVEVVADSCAYREERDSILGILETPLPKERWTSRKPLLSQANMLVEQVYARLRAFEGRSQQPSNLQRQKMIERENSPTEFWWDLYVSLADALFFMMNERLNYLIGDSGDDSNKDKELKSMRDWSKKIRSQIVHALVDYTRQDLAFQLAEKYSDFHSLVELCFRCFDDQEKISLKLEEYVDQFGEDFLKSLFDWYLETGRLKELVNQTGRHVSFLQRFLLQENRLELLWINEISNENFEQAADILFKISTSMGTMDYQMTVLSLAKLSTLAITPLGENFEKFPLLNRIDDHLDICRIQAHKKDELLNLLDNSNLGSRSSADSQYDHLKKHHSIKPFTTASRTTIEYFGQIVRQLLSNTVLSIEGLIDYLTLVSYREDKAIVPNAVLALETYLKAFHRIPEKKRVFTLQAIWRRAWICDPWPNLWKEYNSMDDGSFRTKLSLTIPFKLLYHVMTTDWIPNDIVLPLREMFSTIDVNFLKEIFPDKSDHQVKDLVSDYEKENRRLLEFIENFHIEDFFSEIYRIVPKIEA